MPDFSSCLRRIFRQPHHPNRACQNEENIEKLTQNMQNISAVLHDILELLQNDTQKNSYFIPTGESAAVLKDDCKTDYKKLFSGHPIYERVSYNNGHPDVQPRAKKLHDDLSAFRIKYQNLQNKCRVDGSIDSTAIVDLLESSNQQICEVNNLLNEVQNVLGLAAPSKEQIQIYGLG